MEVKPFYPDNVASQKNFLTREEELALFKQLREGTEEESAQALEKLVLSLYCLTVKLARERAEISSFLDEHDYLQEGLRGLLVAIDHFDTSRGCRLTSPAYYWIDSYIRRARDNQEATIRIPAHISDAKDKVSRTRSKIEMEEGREALDTEVADRMEVTPTQLQKLIKLARRLPSLDAPIADSDEGPYTLLDTIASPASKESESLDDDFIHDRIASALDRLSPRQRYVIRGRFGLNSSGEHKSLEKIGKELNVTRERIRQIETKALIRLRSIPAVMRSLVEAKECFTSAREK